MKISKFAARVRCLAARFLVLWDRLVLQHPGICDQKVKYSITSCVKLSFSSSVSSQFHRTPSLTVFDRSPTRKGRVLTNYSIRQY